MHEDPAAYGVDADGSWLLHGESFQALRECARRDLAWLERTIRDVEPGTPRIEDLAYVLADVGDPELWKRCKRDLIAKVPWNRHRSLATNIGHYKDAEEVDLLLRLVPRREDFAGAAALQALARIDPDLAIDQLVQLPRNDLVLARSWIMPLLLEVRGDETRQRIFEHMSGLPDPLSFPLVYQGGCENEMDSRTVDLLLDVLGEKLEYVREPAGQPHSPPYWLLSMLAEIHATALLKSFEAKQGSVLEENLVLFLVRLGPRSGVGVDGIERDTALAVLQKIGGAGLTAVINAYLQGSSRYGRHDAIALALSAPDTYTRALLVERGLQDELWDGHPDEQSEAAQALASLGDAKDLIKIVIRLGLKMQPDLDDFITASRPFDDETMAPAFAILADTASTENQRVGAVLAGALGRRLDLLPQILALALNAAPQSPLALASVLAVGLLKSHDEPTMELLRSQLEVADHQHAARIALWNIRSDATVDILLEHADRHEDHALVALLTQHERSRLRALQIVRAKLPHLLDGIGSIDAHDVLARLNDASVLEILREESIREAIRAIAIGDRDVAWLAGLRYQAIRTLAHLDSRAAFLACRAAIESAKEPGREAYPGLLLKLDEERAIAYLFERCAHERSSWMAHVIARALAEHDVHERIAQGLSSTDPQARRAACIVASYCAPGDDILTPLRAALYDPDRAVADEALRALRKLRRAREVQELLRTYEAETDVQRRWILVDALAGLGDPGDSGNGWPAWSVRIAATSSTAINRYLTSRIKKAREEMKRRADDEDRNRSR